MTLLDVEANLPVIVLKQKTYRAVGESVMQLGIRNRRTARTLAGHRTPEFVRMHSSTAACKSSSVLSPLYLGASIFCLAKAANEERFQPVLLGLPPNTLGRTMSGELLVTGEGLSAE
jgi:hypothetical protein